MPARLSLTLIVAFLAAPLAGRLAAAEEVPPADPETLATAVRAEMNAWKYEEAFADIEKLAKAAPGDPRLLPLRLELLSRIGCFAEAAGLAAKADPAVADKLPVDAAMRIGRALVSSGKLAEGRRWILAAVRRAGPEGAERSADTLAALIAPHAGPGLVTRAFAAEMSAPEAARAEAAKSYREVLDALTKAAPGADEKARPRVRLAAYAAARRLAELTDDQGDWAAAIAALSEVGGADDVRRLKNYAAAACGKPADASPKGEGRGLGSLTGLSWQVPIGVDEQPARVLVAGGLVLVAANPNGRALSKMPLAAVLRFFRAATGDELWHLDLVPRMENAAAGPATTSHSARAGDLAADGKRAYVLVRHEQVTRVGASQTGRVYATTLVAVDLTSGKPLWTVDAPAMAERVYLAGGNVIAAGFRNLAGFAAADGREIWSRELERVAGSEGAVTAAGLVLVDWREVVCLDPANGKPLWACPRGATDAVVRKCLSDGPWVAVGESTAKGRGNDIRVIDGAAGKQLWSRSFAALSSEQSKNEMELALAGGGLVAGNSGILRSMGAKDGAAGWRVVLPPVGGSPARLTGAGEDVLWCSGGAVCALSAADGKPRWWSPVPPGESRPVEVAAVSGDVIAVTAGQSPRLLARLSPAPESVEAARTLGDLAATLHEKGRAAAVGRLLDIARNFAVPGSSGIELAAFRLEAPGAFAERGLLVAALAAASGDPAREASAAAAAAIVLDGARAPETDKCLAAAALLVLKREAGGRFLAAKAAVWTAAPDRLSAVLTACRAEIGAGAPVAVAGLAAATDPAVRERLAEHLAAYKTPEVRAALEKLLSADPHRNVRMAAAASLAAVAAQEAVPQLEAGYRREDDLLVRERLAELLAGLGHPVGGVLNGHRPLPPDNPAPPLTPAPAAMTRDEALAKLAKTGKVLWNSADAAAPTMTWIAVEKKFVCLFNSADGTLSGYEDFTRLVGKADVTVAGLACGTDTVWAATDRGAFAFDRRARAWNQLVINMDFEMIDAEVEKVALTGNGVSFTVKGKGAYEFDVKTRKWRKL